MRALVRRQGQDAHGAGCRPDLPRLRRRDNRAAAVPGVPRRERHGARAAADARGARRQAHPDVVPARVRGSAPRPARRPARHRRHGEPDGQRADRAHEPAPRRGRPRARALARLPHGLVDQARQRPHRGLVDRLHSDLHDGRRRLRARAQAPGPQGPSSSLDRSPDPAVHRLGRADRERAGAVRPDRARVAPVPGQPRR